MSGIFNSAIFNNAIFNTGTVAPAPPVGGSPHPNARRRRKQINQDDEDMQIILAAALRTIAKDLNEE